jgi:hypothetical protein
MKRNLGKHVSENIRRIKEDMQELQRMMTHKSVYARQTVVTQNRRPKHPKRYYGYYDLYQNY